MRYFIELSYLGTRYHGWQRQPNAVSVQQTLEEALSTILRQNIEITGCGRTDTGVHSSHYIAHLDAVGEIPTDPKFIYHLNAILPKDIALYNIYRCEKHARFDATSRQYQYHIARIKDPFSLGQSWQLTCPLNCDAMQQAATQLLGTQDFSSFEKLHSDNKTSTCTITCAQWEFTPERYTFTITGDRFLRGMVRAIVATLVDVGRGKISVQKFGEIIAAKNRKEASGSAPSDGLFLTKIEY